MISETIKYGLYDTESCKMLRVYEEHNEGYNCCWEYTYRAQFDYGEALKLDSVDDVLDAVMPLRGSPEWYNADSPERQMVDVDFFVENNKLKSRFKIVKFTETVEEFC